MESNFKEVDKKVNLQLKDDTKVNEEEDTVPSAFKVYDKTPKSLATSYTEIDIIRKDSQRTLRNKRLLKKSVSARTKKMDDIFDNLKKSEDGQEKIMLADRKTRSKKFLEYNFSSDSEDTVENFKLEKRVKKSSKIILGSEKSIKRRGTPRNKRLNKVNNSGTENGNKNNSKPKTGWSRANTKKIDLKSRQNLEDQCMRDIVAEVLNNSLVKEEPRYNINEVEPVIKEAEMDTIIEIYSDQDSESSLPALIVEKEQVHRQADDPCESALLDNLINNLIENYRTPPLNWVLQIYR